MMRFHSSEKFFATLFIAGLAALPLKADMLELTNGDHYRGTVISMTTSNVEFQSEIQGRVTLPRSKVANITLNEVVAKPIVVTKSPAPAIVGSPNTGTNATHITGANPAVSAQANAVVEQLRQQGVAPKLIEQVQQQIFGKSSPEAAQKFDELMNGLMTGRVSVEDIRKQAQTSIAQIRSAKKDLGGDAGDMLDSYLVILEKFVQEAGDEVPATKPAPATIPVK